jgi:hypothetical protein
MTTADGTKQHRCCRLEKLLDTFTETAAPPVGGSATDTAFVALSLCKR